MLSLDIETNCKTKLYRKVFGLKINYHAFPYFHTDHFFPSSYLVNFTLHFSQSLINET